MNNDNLFEDSNGDPLDDPAWKTAKVTTQVPDLVGCPMTWLEQVLPHVQGECQLVVALLMYRRWVICGRHKTFEFPNADLTRLGISRAVKSKALTKFEEAGLITVKQQHGHAPKVTRRWK